MKINKFKPFLIISLLFGFLSSELMSAEGRSSISFSHVYNRLLGGINENNLEEVEITLYEAINGGINLEALFQNLNADGELPLFSSVKKACIDYDAGNDIQQNLTIISLLLDCGASPNQDGNSEGKSALGLALETFSSSDITPTLRSLIRDLSKERNQTDIKGTIKRFRNKKTLSPSQFDRPLPQIPPHPDGNTTRPRSASTVPRYEYQDQQHATAATPYGSIQLIPNSYTTEGSEDTYQSIEDLDIGANPLETLQHIISFNIAHDTGELSLLIHTLSREGSYIDEQTTETAFFKKIGLERCCALYQKLTPEQIKSFDAFIEKLATSKGRRSSTGFITGSSPHSSSSRTSSAQIFSPRDSVDVSQTEEGSDNNPELPAEIQKVLEDLSKTLNNENK